MDTCAAVCETMEINSASDFRMLGGVKKDMIGIFHPFLMFTHGVKNMTKLQMDRLWMLYSQINDLAHFI